MAFITKSQLLTSKPPHRDVELSDGSGSFRIQALTLRARMELLDVITTRERMVEDYENDQALPEEERQNLPEVKSYRSGVPELIFAIIDPETGERLFGIEDYEAFDNVTYSTLNELYAAHLQLSAPQSSARLSELKKSSD